MTPERQQYLFQRYFQKTATTSEVNELMQWLSEQADEVSISTLMDEAWENFQTTRGIFSAAQSTEMLGQILQSRPAAVVPIHRGNKTNYLRLPVAAAILVVAGIVAYWLLYKPKPKTTSAISQTQQQPIDSIFPATDKAILTLANGEQIILDDAGNGSLAGEGGVQVIKLNGQLSYTNNAGQQSREILYNTITTAKGKQYKLVLADGTGVWLNAASTLRFPVSFPPDERRVELNGEGYFEVSKDAKRQFSVNLLTQSKSLKGNITALGTAFNINSYDNESIIRTTLLQGSVRASKPDCKPVLLQPGQQACFKGQQVSVVQDANTDQALAWKNNLFNFDNESIEDIMRQLCRWYDIEVSYDGPIPDKHYFGSIRRQVNLKEIVKMLEIAGDLSFTLEGNSLHIKCR